MFLVDSHCHLDFLNYQSLHRNISDVVAKANTLDIKIILSVSSTLQGFCKLKSAINYFDNILLSCGVHPVNIDTQYDLSALHRLAKDKRVVAIGETGLDYHHQKYNKTKQKEAFREHIYVAHTLNKPIIIHTRNAYKDTLSILCEEKAAICGGVFHCFTENLSIAKIVLDMGFYISFSGIITFRNAEELHEVVRYVPIDRILVETDSPYLAPTPYRGRENQPAYLRYIAEFLAGLKKISLEELASITTSNFSRLFQVEVK